MTQEQIDKLAYTAYLADMRAEGDPLTFKWEALHETSKRRYRAIVQSVIAQYQKMEGNTKNEQ